MEQIKKLKVAWICHFSKQDVRNRLPLTKHFLLLNALKYLLGKTKAKHRDFAPWVINLISEFEKFEDVELHVISPHTGLKRTTAEFEMNGVKYHFFKPDTPILHCPYPANFFANAPRFKRNRRLVGGFLKHIQPDIVNLIGTENPYYSITALDIEDFPVFALAQTVYTNPDRKKLSGSVNMVNWHTELQIHRKVKYYGCSGRMHFDLIKINNPDAIIFKNFFPIQKPGKVKKAQKEFDFVFFAAGVTAKKGIEDALKALAIIKKRKADVTMNVVGMCKPYYRNFLDQMMLDLDITESVSFDDYFPLHADMHQHIKKAKFAILPVKLDVISSAVIEAMLLELPVVTYKTTGTPYLNKDGETVLLADIGDIETLAKNMLKLLESPELAKKLKKAAKAFVEREFDNTQSAKRLVKNYKAVIDHYHHNIPIPDNLLFNPEEFPVY
jgi:glycosyltransferase involved in cell wall biosynthesis